MAGILGIYGLIVAVILNGKGKIHSQWFPISCSLVRDRFDSVI
jgi:hypothetical protein